MSESSRKRIKALIEKFIQGEWVGDIAGENRRDWINHPKRAARCWEAADSGCDGSTHQEVIGDWREAWKGIIGARPWKRCDRVDAAVEAYFDEVELWHEKNGTLFTEVG